MVIYQILMKTFTLKRFLLLCGKVISSPLYTEYILSELHSEFCEDDLPEDGSGEDEETKMTT